MFRKENDGINNIFPQDQSPSIHPFSYIHHLHQQSVCPFLSTSTDVFKPLHTSPPGSPGSHPSTCRLASIVYLPGSSRPTLGWLFQGNSKIPGHFEATYKLSIFESVFYTHYRNLAFAFLSTGLTRGSSTSIIVDRRFDDRYSFVVPYAVSLFPLCSF